MGCTSAIVFTCFGAAYGTAKAGVGISAMGVLRPDLIVKSTYTAQYRAFELAMSDMGMIQLKLSQTPLHNPREGHVLTNLKTSSQSSWLVSLPSTASSSPS
jgi:hypothetical protein